MNLPIIRVIFFKELLDTLRDKRTVIASLVMPTMIYPALFLFSSQALVVQQSAVERSDSRVAVVPAEAEMVHAWLGAIEAVTVVEPADPEAALESGDLDAVVALTGGDLASLENGGSILLEIQYDATEMRSREARQRLKDGLAEPRDTLEARRLEAAGLSEDYIKPLRLAERNVAPPAKTAGSLLGAVLPLIMVLMLGLGAFYPAVDLTAGEKERGTFETLLSTPVAKLDIVAGKFMAVFTLSMLTGLLNLGSMMLTLLFQFSQLSTEVLPLDFQFGPMAALTVLAIMLPLAFFISSVMMAIAVCARSFKEAQNFVTPFFLFLMFPAMLAAIPGAKLTTFFLFVPIANASLLFKELLVGTVPFESVFAVVLSTGIYAGLGLLLAAWLFQRDEVLLAEERGIPLTIRRDAFVPRVAPTPGMALALFCGTLVLIFYGGTYAQGRALLPGLLFTEWILIFMPTVAVLAYTRVNLRRGLGLYLPVPSSIPASLLMSAGWTVLIIQFSIWFNRVFPMSEEMARQLESLFAFETETYGILTIIAVVAISPAICEEILFRGALLSGLRPRLPAWATVLVIGVLFGVFHLSIYRVVPTALTGFVLTYVALRAHSIFPAMLMHFLNNALGVLLLYPAVSEMLRPVIDLDRVEEQGLPFPLLLLAAVMFVAGVFWLERSARRYTPAGD